MDNYYVVCSNCYGASERVEHFASKAEALKFIESLPDDYYMVILRNDVHGFKTLKI